MGQVHEPNCILQNPLLVNTYCITYTAHNFSKVDFQNQGDIKKNENHNTSRGI